MQSTCPLHLRCSQELQTTALGRTGLEPIRIEACKHGSMSAWVRTRVMGKQPYERRLERTPIAPCAQLVGWYDHALCKIGYESLVRTNPFPNLQWAMKRAYRTSQTRSQRQHTTIVTDRMHAAFTVPLTAPNYLDCAEKPQLMLSHTLKSNRGIARVSYSDSNGNGNGNGNHTIARSIAV